MSHHRRALAVIGAAVGLDFVLGLGFASAQHIPVWLGLYCALANAVTVGGTVAPSAHWGYLCTALECALVVPLFAATFSLFTSGLAAVHVRDSEQRIKQHVEIQLTANRKALTVRHDDASNQVSKLTADVGELADVTRAVLEHARKPRASRAGSGERENT